MTPPRSSHGKLSSDLDGWDRSFIDESQRITDRRFAYDFTDACKSCACTCKYVHMSTRISFCSHWPREERAGRGSLYDRLETNSEY